MGPSEMILLPVALRQLEPHSELETVQYCSFWWPWRFMCPGGMRKFQVSIFRLVVKCAWFGTPHERGTDSGVIDRNARLLRST